MSLLPTSTAGRLYHRRILVAMSLYVVCFLFADRSFRQSVPSHAAAVLLSLLPAVPLVSVLVIVGLYLHEETDEFERTKLVQTLLWSMGGTLAVTSVWGFLQNFHQAPPFPASYVFMLFWFFAALAGAAQYLYYRAPTGE